MTDPAPPEAEAPPPAPKPVRRKPPWRGWIIGLVAFLGLLVLAGIGVRYAAKTEAGRNAALSVLEGLKIGPLGRLHIEGLQGDLLGDLSVRRLEIIDAKGAWLDARDVHAVWSPGELLFRRVHVRLLAARLLEISRQPILTKEPQTGPSQLPVAVILDKVHLELHTEPALSAVEGRWLLDADLRLARDGALRTHARATSLLHAGDHAAFDLTFGGDDRFLLNVDAVEGQGGALAGVLGLPTDQRLQLLGRGDGDEKAGSAHVIAHSGADTPAELQADWAPSGAKIVARLSLTASKLTRPWVGRIGPEARVVILAHEGKGDLYDLDASLIAKGARLHLKGPLDWRMQRTGGIAVDAVLPDLSAWSASPKIGAAQTSGMLAGDLAAFTYKGSIAVDRLAQSDYALARVSGPIAVTRSKSEWRVQTTLDGAGGAGKGLPAALLGARPHLMLDGALLKDDRWLIRSLDLTGAAVKVNATGGQGLFGKLSFKGSANLINLAALQPKLKGGFSATWNASEGAKAGGWSFDFDGRGAGFVSGFADLDHLLGPTPRLTMKGAYVDGGLKVASSQLAGSGLQAAARGGLDSKGGLGFDVTWSATGPILAGPLQITGAAKGAGKITGTLGAPKASLTADLASVVLGKLGIAPAHLNLDLAQGPTGLDGDFALTGPAPGYGPAHIKSAFHVAGDGVDLTGVDADAGGIKANGAISLRSGEPSSADLTFTAGSGAFLTAGKLDGVVKITGDHGSATARISIDGANVDAPGIPVTLQTLKLTAAGPLSHLPYQISAESRKPVTWKIAGNGVLARGEADTSISFSGGGKVRKADIRTLDPLTVKFGKAGTAAHLNLAVAGGQALVNVSQTGETLTAKANVNGVGLAAFQQDFVGKLTGDLSLQGQGTHLGGVLNAELAGARTRDAPASQSLDARIKGTLSDRLIHIDAGATNAEGLKSVLALDLPAEAAAQPFRVAIDKTKPMHGTFTADGEIRSLWDLVTGGERTLSGKASVQANIAGSLNSPAISGRASVVDGGFHDGATGLALQHLAVDATFAKDAINVSRFSGVDAKGGAASGEGKISLARDGSSTFSLSLKRFQLLDNDIGRATASGAVTVTRDAKGHARLSGALTIDQANITATTPTPTGVVPMDVIEIHRKPKSGEDEAPPKLGPQIDLDVTIKANRGLFVRGRGLIVELSLDAHVGGNSGKPELTGVARVVGGSYDFAGKRFDFNDSGVVRLGSTPDQIRLNLTASWDDPTLNAVVKVQGTAAKPEITLSSTPVLPPDEVLSRVLFGVSASQLSAAQGAELASALASLAGGGGFDVIGNLRQFAGLDRLALGGTQASGTTVSGGKYLTNDVYLELTGGGRTGPSAEVEWRVRRNLSLISQVGTQGDARLSVQFRKAY